MKTLIEGVFMQWMVAEKLRTEPAALIMDGHIVDKMYRFRDWGGWAITDLNCDQEICITIEIVWKVRTFCAITVYEMRFHSTQVLLLIRRSVWVQEMGVKGRWNE